MSVTNSVPPEALVYLVGILLLGYLFYRDFGADPTILLDFTSTFSNNKKIRNVNSLVIILKIEGVRSLLFWDEIDFIYMQMKFFGFRSR
tara:strand:+ start:173 stop:439 length:267 start_codon:yes stop_codon:yes gene_type:complete